MILAGLAGASGCALDPSVSVYPLLLTERRARPFDNVVNLVDAGDYGRAIQFRSSLLSKEVLSVRELMALGEAELSGGYLPDAFEHLRLAWERARERETKARAAWLASQALYLQDRFGESLEWVERSESFGLDVSASHVGFLRVLSEIDEELRISGETSGRIPMSFGEPLVPRVGVSLNGYEQIAVVDTGAVYTIVSRGLAERSSLRTLDQPGTLLGLLGEEIAIDYGILDELEIGDVTVRNLPVAVMSDESLRFFTVGKQQFQMEMLLGANLLRRFRLDFDFDAKTLEMEPVREVRPDDEPNLFLVGFRPMVQTTVNRTGWYMFLVDTGSEVTFLNSDKLEATAVRGREQIHGATLQGLGGSKKRGSQLLNVEVAAAGWAGMFSTLPLYGQGESDSFGIIGQNFMSKFRLIIDFGTMRIDMLRNGQTAEEVRGIAVTTD